MTLEEIKKAIKKFDEIEDMAYKLAEFYANAVEDRFTYFERFEEDSVIVNLHYRDGDFYANEKLPLEWLLRERDDSLKEEMVALRKKYQDERQKKWDDGQREAEEERYQEAKRTVEEHERKGKK